ncbi:MAG: hypothetical protein U9M92_02740 [Patescibacteria group bacterium]|nr:hypothetical protein [Patescibacteria group bacterium]
MTLIFSLSGLVIALALAGLLYRQQSVALRGGYLTINHSAGEQLAENWQRRIDAAYFGFGYFFKNFGHYICLYTLLIIKSIVAAFRYVLSAVEEKCGSLIESIHRR